MADQINKHDESDDNQHFGSADDAIAMCGYIVAVQLKADASLPALPPIERQTLAWDEIFTYGDEIFPY